MECFAERNCDIAASIPAHFDDACFVTGKPQRGGEPRGRAARVKHDVAIDRRTARRRKSRAKRAGELGTPRRDVDHCHLCVRQRRTKICYKQANKPSTYHRNSIRRAWPRVPHRVERGLHIGCKHGATRGDTIGYGKRSALGTA